MTWEEEQTMSLLVPVSACQQQAQDLKLSSMIIKHWNMCFTILITCPAVAFALQSGCNSLLMLFKLAFHSPNVFLKIRACWWLSLLSRVSLQQLKGSSWFQKKTVGSKELRFQGKNPRTVVKTKNFFGVTSLDLNNTFIYTVRFCLLVGWFFIWVGSGFFGVDRCLKFLDLFCVAFSHWYTLLWNDSCLHLQQWTLVFLYTFSIWKVSVHLRVINPLMSLIH